MQIAVKFISALTNQTKNLHHSLHHKTINGHTLAYRQLKMYDFVLREFQNTFNYALHTVPLVDFSESLRQHQEKDADCRLSVNFLI